MEHAAGTGAGAGGSNPDAGDRMAPQGTTNARGKSSTKAKYTKSEQTSDHPGPRYQCPRCPKNFSRIENLTRHQANRRLVEEESGRKLTSAR